VCGGRNLDTIRRVKVPFVDLKTQYDSLRGEILGAIEDVLEQTSFILGPQVAAFEAAFARYIGVPYCVSVESGTAALKLALAALDIGAGDEVILPANTYVASAMAVSAVGAVPVLVDVDDETYLADADAMETAITPRTKALMPVHLYGQAVPMQPILELARSHGLYVVEDACQAHGALWDSRRTGGIGTVGCFSFYPGKNLGAYGDGGAVVTSDKGVFERIKLLRDFGQRKKYEHLIKGDNCRLDSIQAAVLGVKLRYLDEWNERRRDNAALYDACLGWAKFPAPKRLDAQGHVYHLYVVEVEDRDRVAEELGKRGIATGVHYPIPIHLQPAYADLRRPEGSFPVTEAAAHRVLSLPMYPELKAEHIRYVVDALREVAHGSERRRRTVA
jgi:dTDP-4-amino-4,6-dideoxygalactose transaminase